MERKGLVCVVAALVVGAIGLCGRSQAQELELRVPTQWLSETKEPMPLHPLTEWRDTLDIPVKRDARGQAWTERAPEGVVLLVVHDNVWGQTRDRVDRLVADLVDQGYGVQIWRFVAGPPEKLRDDIAELRRKQPRLEGAVLIGDIPYISYERMETPDFGSTSIPRRVTFPCDLYYMDLDGTWGDELDNDAVDPHNGYYDTRSGNLDLEIWVSRIKTDNLSVLGGETELLNAYLDRDHTYRTSPPAGKRSALVYIDDDWTKDSWPAEDRNAVAKVYGTAAVELIKDPDATTADDYRAKQLPRPVELMFVRSHGTSADHGFYEAGRTRFRDVGADSYVTQRPPARFYSLFICSGCDYRAAQYLGGRITFGAQAGLVSWGSAKTGGMLYDDTFYQALADAQCFGAAFKTWFNATQQRYSAYPDYVAMWWYGMVLLGDGTLRVHWAAG